MKLSKKDDEYIENMPLDPKQGGQVDVVVSKPPTDDLRWFKNAIIEYIKGRGGQKTNIQDIHAHFKIAITFETVSQMVNDGELIRKDFLLGGWNGHHSFEVAC